MIIRLSIPFQYFPINSNYIQLTSSISNTHDTSMSWLQLHQNSAKRQGGNTSSWHDLPNFPTIWVRRVDRDCNKDKRGPHLAHKSNQWPLSYSLDPTLSPILFSSLQRKKSQPKVPSPEICRGMAPGCCRILKYREVEQSYNCFVPLWSFVYLLANMFFELFSGSWSEHVCGAAQKRQFMIIHLSNRVHLQYHLSYQRLIVCHDCNSINRVRRGREATHPHDMICQQRPCVESHCIQP